MPAGELVWLQGFDGNPPTPGFQVDGTLLLRSVDDIANIGVNLLTGAITNSPAGTIRVEVGVSGGRFTIFALVDALTRLAQQVEYAGDRTAIDVQAAGLLALAA